MSPLPWPWRFPSCAESSVPWLGGEEWACQGGGGDPRTPLWMSRPSATAWASPGSLCRGLPSSGLHCTTGAGSKTSSRLPKKAPSLNTLGHFYIYCLPSLSVCHSFTCLLFFLHVKEYLCLIKEFYIFAVFEAFHSHGGGPWWRGVLEREKVRAGERGEDRVQTPPTVDPPRSCFPSTTRGLQKEEV